MRQGPPLAESFRRPFASANIASLVRDALAGGVASLVTVSYCISFAALIFQGSLTDGFTLGLAAILTGTVITGLIVSLTTTLAPADAGPDTPAIAVMSVLASAIAAHFAAAGQPSEVAVIHVMIAITISTLVTGLVLLTFGLFKLGVWLRFVPYPVIGGFLAASGWLLITGGVQVMADVNPELSLASLTALFSAENLPLVAVGTTFAVVVFAIRRWIDSFLLLPLAFFAAAILLDCGLLLFGLADTFGGTQRWFLQGMGSLHLWMPLASITAYEIDWGLITQNAAAIGAVCGVTAVSTLLDVTSIEVARQKSADLDKELRVNGFANVVTALLGGVVGNISLSGSILINEAGAISRMSGVFAALVSGMVLLFGADIATLIPLPLLGGLLAYLGMVILEEAIIRSPAQRSGTDVLLAGAIMAVIIYSGYLLGVLLGVVGACLLFAFSYSRIGVIRRHLTRAQFSSNVDRSPDKAKLLFEQGHRIHFFWLSGFIFFGSSNGLFEQVRRSVDARKDPRPPYLILDFSAVPGLDTSAVLSLVKLKHYCDEQQAVLVFSGLTDQMRKNFEGAGFFKKGSVHQALPGRNEALEWCENMLLRDNDADSAADESFEDWLHKELGRNVDLDKLTAYFQRLEFEGGDAVIEQGGASDSVDMLAAGGVAIVFRDQHGRETRLRRMAGQTVIGEMGFYRNVPRGAAVIAEQPSILYRLTREAFSRMQKEDPAIASAFNQMIIRLLSDRLDFANKEIAALI